MAIANGIEISILKTAFLTLKRAVHFDGRLFLSAKIYPADVKY
jgi:hypothetical protein